MKSKLTSCGEVDYELVSYNKISVSSSCYGTISAHLYVKKIYYYGWYSDYYYYWDYYDDNTLSLDAYFNVSISDDGKKATYGNVKLD